MTDLRAWGFLDQHLAADAVVALVDGELSAGAHDRASAHLARCPFCAAEVAAQRQASRAVRGAGVPAAPTDLLASLMAIPQVVELPGGPDGLALTPDGQLVAVLKPEEASSWGLLGGQSTLGSGRPFGSTDRIGSTDPLGSRDPLGSDAMLGDTRRSGRRGASIVVSGLVLGALALSIPVTGPEPRATYPVLPGPNIGMASLRGGDNVIAPVLDARPARPVAPSPTAVSEVPMPVQPAASAEPAVSMPVSVPLHSAGR